MATQSPLGGVSMMMLGVKSVECSLAFYRDPLGLQVTTQFPGFAFLSAGAIQLVLSEPLGRQTETRGGATELVFAVKDVTATHEELAGRGVQFTQTPRQVTPTDWAANFDDPDGHHFSIYGPERAA